MNKKQKSITNDGAIIAEESFVADAQFRIQKLLNDQGMSRVDLANALDVSEPRVSQMFSAPARNLTLRTVARIFYVLGEECYLASPRLNELLDSPLENERLVTDVLAAAELKDPGVGASRGMVVDLFRHTSEARDRYRAADDGGPQASVDTMAEDDDLSATA